MKQVFFIVKYFIALLCFTFSALLVNAQNSMQAYKIDSNLVVENCEPMEWTANKFDCCNLEMQKFENDSLYQDTLKALTKKWDLENTKIEIPNLINQSQVIHYGNSKLFVDLKTKNDSLINSFENELIKNTALVPILYIDSATGKIKKTINIDPEKLKDSISIVETIAEMEAQNGKITVSFDKNNTGEIYYFESQTLLCLRLDRRT